MLSYCLKSRRNREKNKSRKNKNRGTMLLSKCAVRDIKKLIFLKDKEPS